MNSKRVHSRPVSRRRALQLASAGTVVLAGCLGGGDDGTTDEDAGEDENGNENDGEKQNGDESAGDDATATQVDDEPDDKQTDEDDAGEGDEAGPGIETELPITGQQVPTLAGFDETMVSFMEEFEIDAGALGVARDGEVVLERGYGWADEAETTQTAPDSFFRIGSISKSLTRAAVYELVEGGELSYEEPVLSLLAVEPSGGEPADERFSEITVRDLVDHRAGLTPSGNPEFEDPVFAPRAVANHLNRDSPPTTEDFVQYLLDQELVYDPGTPAEELTFNPYSNAGYVVLTHAIESVTSQSYQSYLESTVLPAPDEVGVARADPTQRHPREVSYHSPRQYPTALDPDSDEEVPWADGGFLLEPMAGAGGHYASTKGLLAFMRQYWVFFGEPRANEVDTDSPAALGSLPGTLALAYHYDDNTEIVALFNRRPANPREWSGILRSLDAAGAAVEEWPN